MFETILQNFILLYVSYNVFKDKDLHPAFILRIIQLYKLFTAPFVHQMQILKYNYVYAIDFII